jgi:hypothetical protein
MKLIDLGIASKQTKQPASQPPPDASFQPQLP